MLVQLRISNGSIVELKIDKINLFLSDLDRGVWPKIKRENWPDLYVNPKHVIFVEEVEEDEEN